ncbi:MAG: hypothetical protein WC708_18315 [Lentisphaeria bacterium]
MKTFLGLQVLPKARADNDYIESIRKKLARSKWLAVFHGIMTCAFLAMLYSFHRLVFKTQGLLQALGGMSFDGGVQIGITLGFMQGFLLLLTASSMVCAILTVKGNRTERLLVKYHDELNRRLAPSQTDLSPPA